MAAPPALSAPRLQRNSLRIIVVSTATTTTSTSTSAAAPCLPPPRQPLAPASHRPGPWPQQAVRPRVCCLAPQPPRRRIALPLFSYICRSCVDVLEELLPCRALEQVCVYSNCFDKLELFTALLAKGYPQPAALQLQADMNALPLVRFLCFDRNVLGCLHRNTDTHFVRFMKDNQPARR